MMEKIKLTNQQKEIMNAIEYLDCSCITYMGRMEGKTVLAIYLANKYNCPNIAPSNIHYKILKDMGVKTVLNSNSPMNWKGFPNSVIIVDEIFECKNIPGPEFNKIIGFTSKIYNWHDLMPSKLLNDKYRNIIENKIPFINGWIIKPKIEYHNTTDIIKCSRCGENHLNINFFPFTKPVDEWTHWAMCPNLNEPIFVKYE